MTDPLTVLGAAVAGALAGLAADRLAVRWPRHEPGTPARGFDWRTLVVAGAGAVVAAGLVNRWTDTLDLAILGVVAVALVVLLATDLDQRLLPDVITLPLVLLAGVLLIAGQSPLLADDRLALASGIGAGIGAPLLLLLSDRVLRGELGGGDLKLAAGLGLLAGASRLLTGFLVASIGFAVVLIVLLLARRLEMRSAVPFGPVLIGAGFVAMLAP